MSIHQDQIAYWNGQTGRNWSQYHDKMDRGLAQMGGAALAWADPKLGERVLDVGCGAGTTSLLLAERVGPEGDVLGVDISQPMLELARMRAKGRNVRFLEADAAFHSFMPDRDLIFSRFGVMFFAEPVRAFANLRRTVRPGGRLAFICWRDVKENEWATLPLRAAKPHLPPQAPSKPRAPGPFAFADADYLREILTEAGFGTVELEKLDSVMDVGATPEEASFQTTRLIGPTSRALKSADEVTRMRVRAVVTDAFARFANGGGPIRPAAACWLVRGR